MIVDLILDRMDGEEWGERYDPQEFYREAMGYGAIADDITRAMDYGTNEDVQSALCEYIIANEYNPEICEYINSRDWLGGVV